MYIFASLPFISHYELGNPRDLSSFLDAATCMALCLLVICKQFPGLHWASGIIEPKALDDLGNGPFFFFLNLWGFHWAKQVARAKE